MKSLSKLLATPITQEWLPNKPLDLTIDEFASYHGANTIAEALSLYEAYGTSHADKPLMKDVREIINNRNHFVLSHDKEDSVKIITDYFGHWYDENDVIIHVAPYTEKLIRTALSYGYKLFKTQ